MSIARFCFNPLESPQPKLLNKPILFSPLKMVFRGTASVYWIWPMVITEPAVPRAQLLGLGSKLYPSKVHWSYSIHAESLSSTTKERICWQGKWKLKNKTNHNEWERALWLVHSSTSASDSNHSVFTRWQATETERDSELTKKEIFKLLRLRFRRAYDSAHNSDFWFSLLVKRA